jgi:four helix bundle protein
VTVPVRSAVAVAPDCGRLDVYHVAVEFQSCAASIGLARRMGAPRDQLDRASVSIVLNIAEGSGRYSPAEKAHFYLIARGSAMECLAALTLLRARSLVAPDAHRRARALLVRIIATLTRLAASMKARTRSGAWASGRSAPTGPVPMRGGSHQPAGEEEVERRCAFGGAAPRDREEAALVRTRAAVRSFGNIEHDRDTRPIELIAKRSQPPVLGQPRRERLELHRDSIDVEPLPVQVWVSGFGIRRMPAPIITTRRRRDGCST